MHILVYVIFIGMYMHNHIFPEAVSIVIAGSHMSNVCTTQTINTQRRPSLQVYPLCDHYVCNVAASRRMVIPSSCSLCSLAIIAINVDSIAGGPVPIVHFIFKLCRPPISVSGIVLFLNLINKWCTLHPPALRPPPSLTSLFLFTSQRTPHFVYWTNCVKWQITIMNYRLRIAPTPNAFCMRRITIVLYWHCTILWTACRKRCVQFTNNTNRRPTSRKTSAILTAQGYTYVP